MAPAWGLGGLLRYSPPAPEDDDIVIYLLHLAVTYLLLVLDHEHVKPDIEGMASFSHPIRDDDMRLGLKLHP